MRKPDAMTPPADEAHQHQHQPHLDVMVSGLLFQDLVFGLPTAPRPGTEVWASGYTESPGGIANFAVALSRLGLATGLAACFGADDRGDRLWRTLRETEGIDLSRSARIDGWATPLTVALAYDDDRALVTHGGTPRSPPTTSSPYRRTPKRSPRTSVRGRTSGCPRQGPTAVWYSPTSAGIRPNSGIRPCWTNSTTSTSSYRTRPRR